MNINYRRFMQWSFVIVLAMSFVIGKVFGGTIWTALGGLVWCLVVWFVGAVVGHMNCMDDAVRVIAESEKRRQEEFKSREELLDLQAEDTARREKKLNNSHYGQVRAITDRVANRILSKWVPNLSEDKRRECIFQDVEEIMAEEFGREKVGKNSASLT